MKMQPITGCLSFSVELWYMIVDFRREIRGKAFKSFFLENRCGAGYGEFGVIIEAVPAVFVKSVSQVKIASAKSHGIIITAYIKSLEFGHYLCAMIVLFQKL